MSSSNYIPSKTTEFFTKINKIWSIAGLYNLWIIDEYNNKTLKFIHKIITISIYIFIFLEYLALFTQPHLTEKQSKDLLLFVFCHPIFMSYYVGLVYHKKKVKDLLIMLNITLKEIYNDPAVEKRMIRRATIFSITYQLSICVSVFSYGFDGFMQVLRSGHYQIAIFSYCFFFGIKIAYLNLIITLNYLFEYTHYNDSLLTFINIILSVS